MNRVTSTPFVYYRFGGRIVAWGNGTSFAYLLSDHLGSSHEEVQTNQTVSGDEISRLPI